MLSFISFFIPYAIGIAGATSFGLVCFLALTRVQDKISARNALNQLQEYEVSGSRDKDLLNPLRTRILGPAIAKMSSTGNQFNPPAYVESVKEKMLRAGIEQVGALERFLAMRVLGFIAAPVWFIFAFFLPFGTMTKLALAVLGVIALIIVPSKRLDNKIKAREIEIRKAVPDTLDLLVICVEAGLGFEQALDRVVNNVPGPLSREFARMMGQVTAGSTRADALRALQERVDIPEIRSFVLAMIQADTFGVSIGGVLRGQADDIRIKRRQQAQERAQKAPVKMMIPMVFCIFPSLFIVILGPAMLSIYDKVVKGNTN